MKKSILIYGTLSGIVIIGSMLWGILASDNQGGFSAWLGYLIMLVAMTLIFVGVKRYRDQQLGGVIKFGRAFLLGLGITFVASFIYVFVWEGYLYSSNYAFISDYTAGMIKAKQEAGISGAEMDAFNTKMANLEAQYASPFFRLPMTFAEIFPVGLLVSLVSAAILRLPNVLPAKQ